MILQENFSFVFGLHHTVQVSLVMSLEATCSLEDGIINQSAGFLMIFKSHMYNLHK